MRAWPLIALTILGAFAVLYRLDDTALWQDEAETAVLAYNTLKQGYPGVTDSYGNVLLEGGHEANAQGVWTWQSWGQYYVGAIGFGLLNEKSTFAARLPFALLGIACIPLTGLLAMKLFGRPQVAWLACLFLTTSVPFLLFARQCRNYTLATLATILLLWAYTRFIRGESRWGLGLAAALVMLYYAQMLLFAGVVSGLLVHYFLFQREWSALLRILIPLGIAFVFAVPWFLYSGGLERPGQFDPAAVVPHLLKFVLWINNYIFPFLLLIVPVLALRARRTRPDPESLWTLDNPAIMLVVILLSSIGVWSFVFWIFFRYLIIFMPLFFILLAVTVDWIYTRKRLAGLAVGACLVFSNGLSFLPLWLALPYVNSAVQTVEKIPDFGGATSSRIYSLMEAVKRRAQPDVLLFKFAGELRHGYDGPVEAIAAYLNEHAAKDDVVWTNYEDLPLLFYNTKGYRVVSWYRAAMDKKLELLASADWVVPRTVNEHVKIKGRWYPIGPTRLDLEFAQTVADRFIPVELEVYDRQFENRPDPDSHSFRSPDRGDRVVIYRRRVPSRTEEVSP